MMIGHHHVLFYSHLLPTWDSVSLALYPHNANKFVLIVSNFYVAKVLSQQISLLYQVATKALDYCNCIK
jgi:hypothetical protein